MNYIILRVFLYMRNNTPHAWKIFLALKLRKGLFQIPLKFWVISLTLLNIQGVMQYLEIVQMLPFITWFPYYSVKCKLQGLAFSVAESGQTRSSLSGYLVQENPVP